MYNLRNIQLSNIHYLMQEIFDTHGVTQFPIKQFNHKNVNKKWNIFTAASLTFAENYLRAANKTRRQRNYLHLNFSAEAVTHRSVELFSHNEIEEVFSPRRKNQLYRFLRPKYAFWCAELRVPSLVFVLEIQAFPPAFPLETKGPSSMSGILMGETIPPENHDVQFIFRSAQVPLKSASSFPQNSKLQLKISTHEKLMSISQLNRAEKHEPHI